MGYIFDAIHRANQGLAPNQRPGASAGPPPDSSVAPQSGFAEQPPVLAINAAAPSTDAPTLNEVVDPTTQAPVLAESLASPVLDDATGDSEDWTLPPNIDDRLVVLTDPSTVMAEEYRSIRTGILARWQNKRRLIHTITSATPQEGKTITSLNLGLSFAELHNRKTIVIEADLRLPQFSSLCNLPPVPGLMGVLLDGVNPADTIVKLGENKLHLIPAGRCANDHSVQILSSPTMINLLAKLRQEYDHVIIDTPPVVELADAGILGAMSDDVLLIVRMGITPRSLVEQAVRTLASYNAPVAGVIATDQQPQQNRYYRYGYGYRYRYSYRSHQRSKKYEASRSTSKAA